MNLFNKILTLSLALVVSSCGDPREMEEIKTEGRKSFPKREDNWFPFSGIANNKDILDPYNNLDREDYMKIGNNRKFLEGNKKESSLSLNKLENLISGPEDDELITDKLVSISINEDVPLKDALIELVKRAEVDAEIDKNITGSVIFMANEKPFSKVIERLSKQAGLRYSVDDGVLKIEQDTGVVKSYKFNLLDSVRTSSSTINSSLSVGGGAGEGQTADAASGSSNELSLSSGDGEIWTSIETGIAQILASYSGASENSVSASSVLSVNRNAGVISVLASDAQHKVIKEYLDEIHISLTSQVLIEAKVVEVDLDDDYSSGINWNIVTGGLTESVYGGANFGADAAVAVVGGVSSIAGADPNQFKFSILPTEIFGSDNFTLDSSVELLDTFGVTKSLSNPRISTLNNQSAILNFSENEVYFQIEFEEETQENSDGTSDTVINIDSTINTVPIGVVLALQPSIDLVRNEITMNIRPTLTRVSNRISDPGVELFAARNNISTDGLNSQIPVVEVRELDTAMRIKNGEIMVIGGLLEERTANTDSGIPGASRIPYLGNLFKSVNKGTELIETVIFIKATIVPGQGVSVEDKAFYKKFNEGRALFSVD